MTRLETIQEAAMTWLADKYGEAQHADRAFEAGALWADQNSDAKYAECFRQLELTNDNLIRAERLIEKLTQALMGVTQ